MPVGARSDRGARALPIDHCVTSYCRVWLLRNFENAAHERVDPAEVGDLLAGLEPRLRRDGEVPLELLARRADVGRANSELGGVEIHLAPAARPTVGERERRAGRAEAGERAARDRVVDR